MWPYAVVVNYVGLGIVDVLVKREGREMVNLGETHLVIEGI